MMDDDNPYETSQCDAPSTLKPRKRRGMTSDEVAVVGLIGVLITLTQAFSVGATWAPPCGATGPPCSCPFPFFYLDLCLRSFIV